MFNWLKLRKKAGEAANDAQRMPEEQQPQSKMHEYFGESNNWEASQRSNLQKSESRAWKIVYVACGMTLLSWMAIVLMMPLKESIPFVFRVDNTTGVIESVTSIKGKKVTVDDVMNKFWLAKYVRSRETYDWYTLQEDYDTVGLLSSDDTGKAYAVQFNGNDALDKKYGKATRVTVSIISAVPTSASTGTVRFSKTVKRVDDDGPGTTSKWVATIGFEYKSSAFIKESQRLINPFGFQVLSYRVDPEMVGGTQ